MTAFEQLEKPFTRQAHDGEDNASPLYLKNPRSHRKRAKAVIHGFRPRHRPPRLAQIPHHERPTSFYRRFHLVRNAISRQRRRIATSCEGITDQHVIKERMGFHYGKTTLFHINTNCPTIPGLTYEGPRALF